MKKNKKMIIISLVIICILFSVGNKNIKKTYHNLTYYVDVDSIGGDASDNNTGSLESPFKTINKALEVAQPGDTIYCREGTYNEWLYITQGDSSGNYLKISSYPGESATIVPAKLYDNWLSIGDNKWELSLSGEEFIDDFKYLSLIEKDSFAITRVNTLNELDNVPSIAYGYNLFFFNSSTKKITLKIVDGSNPSDNIYVLDAINRVTIASPYIEISNMNIQYSYDGIKVTWTNNHPFGESNPDNNANYARIINNTISHVVEQGILSSGKLRVGGVYSSNKISYCGSPFKYSGTTLVYNNFYHCIYITGINETVNDNYLEKSYGQELHTWKEGWDSINPEDRRPKDAKIFGNTIIGQFVGSGIRNKFYNNKIYTPSDKGASTIAFALYGHSRYEVYNNTIHGLDGVKFGINNKVDSLIFKNNDVTVESVNGYIIDILQSDFQNVYMDNNVYSGNEKFYIDGVGEYTKFDDYLKYMNSKNLESNSIFLGDNTLQANYSSVDISINQSSEPTKRESSLFVPIIAGIAFLIMKYKIFI